MYCKYRNYISCIDINDNSYSATDAYLYFYNVINGDSNDHVEDCGTRSDLGITNVQHVHGPYYIGI